MIECTIEEFEQGAWVADVVSLEPVIGTIALQGQQWSGSVVSTSQDNGRVLTRIVGGAGKLGSSLPDLWYDAGASISVALSRICNPVGEKPGAVEPGVQLQTFQRQRGTVAQALDQLAATFDLIWWIGRDGLVNVQKQRPPSAPASGLIVGGDTDSSVTLVDPEALVLGATYNNKTVRHIRWRLTQDKLTAQAYFLPFWFSSPVQTKYEKVYNAVVESQGADGSVNVIADARFGVTSVKLFCGVPGAKVEVRPGEQVLLGFFGGDPQKPYAVSFGQDPTAAKMVGRVTDSVLSTLTPPEIAALAAIIGSCLIGVAPGLPIVPPVPPVVPPSPFLINGQITGGSPRLKVGD